MKKCSDCRYCIMLEYGYSNWTVEGITVDCLIEKNASMPTDHWYGETPALNVAESCSDYTEGNGVEVDCDRESGELENYSSDEEIKELLRNYKE